LADRLELTVVGPRCPGARRRSGGRRRGGCR
jgi:hypothetical protein